MQKLEFDISGANIAISVPCYKGTVPIDWVCAFAGTQSALMQHGVKSFMQVRTNSGLIHAVRNELVHTALAKPEVTHILFVDDDVIWKPDDVLRLLAWSQKYPFVCGVYSARDDNPTFFVDLDHTGDHKIIKSSEGLLRARGVPGGFMLLKREVFENPKLRAQCPVSHYTRGDLKDELVCGFFDYIHEGLTGTGEDIAFCRRWRRAGGEIWVDPTISLQHVGTKAYAHNYVAYLNAQAEKASVENASPDGTIAGDSKE